MRYDKEQIKNSLTIDDIHKILKELGSSEPKYDKDGNPVYQTVCHNHSGGKHKLYYYEESKQFHCYTDCSESFDIFDLVMKNKSISFAKAIEYVVRTTGKLFGFSIKKTGFGNNEKIDDWNWISKFEKKKEINTELPEYDEKVLDVLLPYPHEEWLKEGISYETMVKFEIGYYIREEKISIVHRDINGRFIGLRGRAMLQEDIDSGKKYMPIIIENKMYNHINSMNLYGLHKTKEAIKRYKKIMITEGEKSVLKADDFYQDANFTCAACSSTISNFQRDIILSLDVEEVFIAFDKFRAKKEDESEEKYQEQLINYQENLVRLAKKFTAYARTYIIYDTGDLLDYKDSPMDKGKETLEELMRNKIEISTNEEVK